MDMVHRSLRLSGRCGRTLLSSSLSQLVDNRILCIHGGLSPSINTIDQVKKPLFLSFQDSNHSANRGNPLFWPVF